MFKEHSKAIYLQIVDRIFDDILARKIRPGDRLLSVREYAAQFQVNPNTMMRAFDYLAIRKIIFNKRGIGYFLSDDAPVTVINMKREELWCSDINEFFRQLQLLGVSPDSLKSKYEEYLRLNDFKKSE